MTITAEFALTRADFVRLQRASRQRLLAQPGARLVDRAFKITLWLLIFIALFIAFEQAGTHPSEAGSFYTVAALLGAAVVLARLHPHFIAARMRKGIVLDSGSFLRPRTLEFTPAAVITTWSTGRFEQQWSEILGHSADDINHYLFVDGCAAIVVPHSAVAAFKSDFDRYVAAIPPK